jgi:MoxR-like ATPase
VTSLDDLAAALEAQGYFADGPLVTALFLAQAFDKPLLLEGEPGVGKTSAALALARLLGRELIRIQCYEGLTSAEVLYEWNHARQLLLLRAGDGGRLEDAYDPACLIERPLLKALRAPAGAVLLIDEIDRADAEFEAFLLEFLGDFQITIPELGTIRAAVPPAVVLTSNRTRELHDALLRRCLYHWIELPEPARERRILAAQAPGLTTAAAARLVEAVGGLRRLPLQKRPGIAETIDWARGVERLERAGQPWPAALRGALGLALKDQEDMTLALAEAAALFEEAAP